jgi:GxxExxY protein
VHPCGKKNNHKGTQSTSLSTTKEKILIMNIENIFKKVLDCSFKVHTALGPGLLESAYEECLYYELKQSGLDVQKQKALPLIYEEVKLDIGYRIDLLVENRVIIEIKSVESLADIHMAQILTYLKLSKCKLGLLVNFNVKHLKGGIKRVIN